MKSYDKTGRQQICGGPGVLVSRFGDQVVLAGRERRGRIDPAFPVLFGGGFVQVGFGLVNDVEPTVGGVPISGKDGEVPQIKIEGYDSEDRSWVMLKVTIDPQTGKFAKSKDAVTVVSMASAGEQRVAGESDTVGLHPLAVLTPKRVHQITFFNLRHAVGYPVADGLGNFSKVLQHFFWS